jgi:hypothetical protein
MLVMPTCSSKGTNANREAHLIMACSLSHVMDGMRSATPRHTSLPHHWPREIGLSSYCYGTKVQLSMPCLCARVPHETVLAPVHLRTVQPPVTLGACLELVRRRRAGRAPAPRTPAWSGAWVAAGTPATSRQTPSRRGLCALSVACQEDTRRPPFKTIAQAFKLGDAVPRECLNTV